MSERIKIVLVVGASSGFGKATVEKLLATGCLVYAAARRTEKMEDIRKKGAHILSMDVTDNASVSAGIEQIIAEQGYIDVVLANAGYGAYGTIESISMEAIQRQYDVNVFGLARVIQAVLPHMRRQHKGRIIFTASVVSQISPACTGWYASTKHALAAVAKALRQEVRDLGIEVVLIEPGIVKTGFDSVAFDLMDNTTCSREYMPLVNGFKSVMSKSYADAPGPEGTVKAMVDAVISTKPKMVYRTTRDAKWLPRIQAIVSERQFDTILLKHFLKSV